MDTLILSCGTGGGHNAAGRAVAEEMIRRGRRCVMLNPYTLHSRKLAERINCTYIRTATFAPKLFGAVYSAGQAYRNLPWRSPVFYANRAMVPVMDNYLKGHHYDAIICTHLFPAEILTNMKQKGIKIPKTIFIATDYTCIPFTEELDCDAYVIPAEELTDEFIARGIPEDRIRPLGIPVRRQFAEKRPVSLERLGLEEGKKYLLISGGSIGAGEMEKTVEKLHREFTGKDTGLIVFCGSNRRLYTDLKETGMENAVILNYTDNAAGYLQASGVFISKPGGLSSTEAAVCGIPLVHIAPIPGCENKNAEFFEKYGMSINCGKSLKKLEQALEKLKDTEVCAKMVMEQRRRIMPDAAGKICALAEEMASPLSLSPEG